MTRLGYLRSPGSFCWMDVKSRAIEESADFFAAAVGWDFRIDTHSWRPRTMVSTQSRNVASFSDLSAPVYPADANPHVAVYLAVDDAVLAVEKAERA